MQKTLKITAPKKGAVKPLSVKNFDKIEADFALKDVEVKNEENKIVSIYFKNGGIIKIEDFFSGENRVIGFSDEEIVTQYNIDKVILEQEYISLSGENNFAENLVAGNDTFEDFEKETLSIKTEGGQIQSSGGGYPLDSIEYDPVLGVGSLEPLGKYIVENMSGDSALLYKTSMRVTGDNGFGNNGNGGINPPPPPSESMEIVMQEKDWSTIKNPNDPSSLGQENTIFSKVSIDINDIERVIIDINGGLEEGSIYIGGIELIAGEIQEIYNKDGTILYAEYSKLPNGSGSIVIYDANGREIDPSILETLLASMQHYDETIGKEYSLQEILHQDAFSTGALGGSVSIVDKEGNTTSQDIAVEYRKYIDMASDDSLEGGYQENSSYYIQGTTEDDIIDLSSTGEHSKNIALGGEGKDTIYGGSGNDFIIGDGSGSMSSVNIKEGINDGEDILFGGNGKDTILGGGGDDLIYGGNEDQTDTGKNIIIGGSGNDTIYAGNKGDIIIGGSREDTASNTGDDLLIGGVGNDSIYGSGGNDTIIGGNGVGPKGDYIVGGQGNNVIFSGSITFPEHGNFESIIFVEDTQNDTITTGAGNDYIVTGGGADLIYSGLGNDTIIVNGESESTITATGGDNDIYVKNNTGSVYTENGRDTIFIEGGKNIVVSGGGNDSIKAISTTGLIDAGEGSDNLFIKNCYDITLLVREGDNRVVIENTSGDLWGDDGHNNITVMMSEMNITLGSGNNTVNFTNNTGMLYMGDGNNNINVMIGTVDIVVGIGDNIINLTNNTGRIEAGEGNNTITANNCNGLIRVGDGRNVLTIDGGMLNVETGDGNNSVAIFSGEIEVALGAGDDTVLLAGGMSTVNTGAGNDYVEVKADGQVLYTEKGNDRIIVETKYNMIDAGEGADTITVHSDYNTIIGGTGDDSIRIVGNINRVELTDGNNILTIEGNENTVMGGSWSDIITVNSGTGNSIITGAGEDYIVVKSTDNYIHAGNHNDTVILEAGNNTVNLGTGEDSFTGSSGDDIVIATGDNVGDCIDLGAGNDSVSILNGTLSTIDGGAGRDTVEIMGDGHKIHHFKVSIKDVEVLHFSEAKSIYLGDKSFSDMLTENGVFYVKIENSSSDNIDLFLESTHFGTWEASLGNNTYLYKTGGEIYTITFGDGFTISLDGIASKEEDVFSVNIFESEMIAFSLHEDERLELRTVKQDTPKSNASLSEKPIKIVDILDNEERIVLQSLHSLDAAREGVSGFEERIAYNGHSVDASFYTEENPFLSLEVEAQRHTVIM